MRTGKLLTLLTTLLGAASGCSNETAAVTPSDAGPETGGEDAAPACASGADPASCLACVHQGLAQGSSADGICAYLGIPYAKPPVGSLRFAPPEPAEGWSDVRDVTAFATACVQGNTGVGLTGGATTGEDCLYLNVWTPADAGSAPLPVMVFVYGGEIGRASCRERV